MSYGQMQNSHVTMIDDLPELNQLEEGMQPGMNGNSFPQHVPHGETEKYQKYIRPTHRMNPQSGMAMMGEPITGEPIGGHVNSYMGEQIGEHMSNQPQQHFSGQPMYNCLDIANHVQQCPICSKFYNNDRTVYIIAIIVLAVTCLLLLKRVLNV